MKYRKIGRNSGIAAVCLVMAATGCGCNSNPYTIEGRIAVEGEAATPAVTAAPAPAEQIKVMATSDSIKVEDEDKAYGETGEASTAVLTETSEAPEKTGAKAEPKVKVERSAMETSGAEEESGAKMVSGSKEESENTKPQYIYKLIYDENGGNLAMQQKKYKTAVICDRTYTFFISAEIPVNDDPLVGFRGWSADKNAVKGEYQPGDEITLRAEDAVKDGDAWIVTVRLYAIWANINIRPVEGSRIK